MHRQAERLAYITPFMAYEERALLGQKMAELLPGDIEKSFYTLGGAEANENAIKIARLFTGRHKIMARYRSYHGATSGAMSLTGDPRRWANEPAMSGVVHVLDPYHGPQRPGRRRDGARTARRDDPARRTRHHRRVLPGDRHRTNDLIPPDGYLQGRDLCMSTAS
jgi:taurine--2-oxoglutarate transaminase